MTAILDMITTSFITNAHLIIVHNLGFKQVNSPDQISQFFVTVISRVKGGLVGDNRTDSSEVRPAIIILLGIDGIADQVHQLGIGFQLMAAFFTV